MSHLILSGGDAEKDMQFKASEVNHLRGLLAWLRCEYMLDEDMQRGYAQGALECVRQGGSQEIAEAVLAKRAAKIRAVPAYVRQAVKMLTKAVHEHDKTGDVVDGSTITMLPAPSK